jgi:hypothetical protein
MISFQKNKYWLLCLHIVNMNFTFPFNTCEIPKKDGIAQPHSTIINTILCIIIFLFLLQSNNLYSRLFLFFVLLFNIFHTLSHAIHVSNFKIIQFLLTHYSAILSSFFLLCLLTNITKYTLKPFQKIGLLCLYLFDVILIYYDVSHLYNIIVFLMILFSIMIIFYKYLSTKIKQNIVVIIGFSCLVLFIDIIEINFCESLLQKYGNIPFHTILEASAFIPIILLCYSFYKI